MNHTLAENPAEPASGAPQRTIRAWAMLNGALLWGPAFVTSDADTITISGARTSWKLYWARFWLIALLFLSAPWWPSWDLPALLAMAAVMALLTFGGRALLWFVAKPITITMPRTRASRPSVGPRVRAWHIVFVALTGIAALVVFAFFPTGRRTVSFLADDPAGDEVRYLLRTKTEREAVELAAMLLG